MVERCDQGSTQQSRDLLRQLSLDEKITLLAAKNVWETPEIDRLRIPSLKVTDGPNGARGGSFFDGTTAACFPSCVSLAATFNHDLCREIGRALGQEAGTKGAYTVLGPTVCCHRSPLGGRNFEAFSEDPYLSGTLAAEYVAGMQGERVAATVKHFLANEQDTRRFSIDQTISERALREIYLKPFEIVVKCAKPWAFMSSYPRINGQHVDAQDKFLKNVLRKEWKYDGLVMSDWGATSTVESIKHGLDLEMPGPPRYRTPEAVQKALEVGKISAIDIDNRVFRTLQLLERVGKFSDRKETPSEQAIDRPEHRALIRKAGAEGIVLLKNERNILPIDIKSTKKIALLGPLADYAAAHGGGSASLNCHYKITPYDAFKARMGDQVQITHSKGAHIYRVYPDLEKDCINSVGNAGFRAQYFSTPTVSNEPFLVQEFPRASFTTLMDSKASGCKSVRFSTIYSPTVSGEHYLSFSGLGPSKLFINDDLIADQPESAKDAMSFLLGVQDEMRVQFAFEAGKKYDITIETHPSPVSNAELHLLDNQCSVHLGYVSQAEMEQDVLAEAVSLAEVADLVILFVGNTVQWETEGKDLDDMTLPANGSQDALVARVAAVNPNVIVVNTTGVPVELPWLDAVPALLQAWYAGQEVGNSILDVLLGEVCPSGKLPISWPVKYEHTGCYGNFGMDSFESKQVEYVEGVFVGYRWFDKFWGQEQEVRFPFGFGLSYTSFTIRDVRIHGDISTVPDSKIEVFATVTNTGAVQGAQTVQVYLEPPITSGVERPQKSLVGFKKVELKPGKETTISFEFGTEAAAFWDEMLALWKVAEGEYDILVATSSHPQDCQARLTTSVREGFTFEA